MRSWILALLCQLLITRCQTSNQPCPQDSYSIRPWAQYGADAQISISAIFPLRENLNGRSLCGHVTSLGVQLSQTAKLVLDVLNRESFIPGIKIGIKLYDLCSHGYGLQEILSTESSYWNCSLESSLGIFGPSSRVLPSSALTSISLDYLSEKTPVLSSVPSIEAIARAMINTARHFQWNYLTVLYENSSFGLKAHEYFSTAVSGEVTCIERFLLWPTDDAKHDQALVKLQKRTKHISVILLFLSGHSALEFFKAISNDKYANQFNDVHFILADAFGQTNALWSMIEFPKTRGMFVVSQTFIEDLTRLESYYSNLEIFDQETKKPDPILADFYQNSVKCKFENVELTSDFQSLPLCSGEKFTLGDTKKDMYVSPVIVSLVDTIYAFGAAYKKLWMKFCNSKPGLCSQLRNLDPQAIKDELVKKFTYDPIMKNHMGIGNRAVNLADKSHNLAVYQLTTDESDNMAFIQIFGWNDEKRWSLLQQPIFSHTNVPKSDNQCSSDCSCKNQKISQTFLYEPGDYIVLGTFPIHQYSEGGQCGAIRSSYGFQMAAAFHYAIQQANQRKAKLKSPLNHIKIGSLIIDSCNNPSKTSYLINGLMLNNKIGEIDIDSSTVIGMLGDLNDNVSAELSSLAKNFHIPHISYGSKSRVVNTFKTTVSDESRLDLTIELLKATNADLVQIASSSAYADFGVDLRYRIEKSGQICIAGSNILDFDNSENVTESVKQILDLVSKNATTLIIAADKRDYKLLLKEIKLQDMKYSHINLLAPVNFGHDADLGREVDDQLIDVITFAVKKQQNPALKSFISSISLDNGSLGPWLDDYISLVDRCDLENSEFHIRNSTCDSKKSLTAMTGFKLDQNLDQVVNAVRALLVSLGQALRKIGCSKETGPCLLSREVSSGNSTGLKLLVDSLKDVIFKDETGKEFSFTKNLDAAYEISILKLSNSKFKQIGFYRQGVIHQFDSSKLSTTKCSDSNLALCQNACPHIFRPTPQSITNISQMTRIYASTNLKRDVTSAASEGNKKRETLVIIGAIFRVTTGRDCNLVDETGVLSAEAFLWAIESLNKRKPSSVAWSFSGLVIDSCGSYGADVLYDLEAILANRSKSRFYIDNIRTENVWAFLTNPSTSENYRSIDSIMSDHMISNIRLSNSNRKSAYALNMQISDESIDYSTLAILEALNWTKIALAYSSESDDIRYLKFISQAQNRSLCPILEYDFQVHQKSYSKKNHLSEFYGQILERKIRILVVLLDEEKSREFLAALATVIREKNDKDPKTMPTLVVVAGNFEPSIQDGLLYLGALTFRQYVEEDLSAFYDHFFSFKMGNNEKNPWWPSFYQQKYKCHDAAECDRITKSDKSSLLHVHTYQETLLTNIINAVRLVAVGLQVLAREVCGDSDQNLGSDAKTSTFCDRLFDEATKSREQFFYALKNSKLELSKSKELLTFDRSGQLDFPTKILNLISDQSADNSLQFELIGSFQRGNLTLREPTIYQNFEIAGKIIEDEYRCRKCRHCSDVQYANEIEDVTTSTTIPSTTTATTTASTTSLTSTTTTTVTPPMTSTRFSIKTMKSKTLDQESIILIPSNNDLYLLILCPLHDQDGQILAEQYENVRSMIWILENFNSKWKNFNIGALIFDTFSDPIRALSFLKDFRDGAISVFTRKNNESLKMKNILGVVNSPLTNEAILISEFLNAMNLTNVSPGLSAHSPKILEEKSDDYSLRTSVSVSYQSKAIVQLFKKLKWNAMAVFYSSKNLWATSAKAALDLESENEQICVAFNANLDFSRNTPESCESKIGRHIEKLFEHRRNGLRAVVLLLEPDSLRCFMKSIKNVVAKGKINPGDFTFVVFADVADLDATFADYVTETVGMIVLRYETADPIHGFQKYMKELQILNKDYRDPWLDSYLKNTMNCQSTFDNRQNLAPECREKLWTFYSRNYTSNSYLLNSMNAASSLLHGFSNFLAVTCGSPDMCPKFKLMLNRRLQETENEDAEATNFRKYFFEYVRGVSFDDVSGGKFEFSMLDVPYSNKPLLVMNLVRYNSLFEFRSIGIFENSRLKLKLLAHGFKNGVEPFNLRDQTSTCLRFLQCPAKCLNIFLQNRVSTNVAHSPEYEESSDNHTLNNTNFSLLKFAAQGFSDIYYPETPMQISFGSPRLLNDSLFISSSKKMYIVGILALHDFDVQNFACGTRYKISSGFQSLLALQYALEQVNNDPYLLPDTKLGLIVVDSCSSQEKTIADLFDYFGDKSLTNGANFGYKKLRRSSIDNAKNTSIIKSNLNIEDVVGIVGLGGKETNDYLRKLLINLQIPHISLSSAEHGQKDALLLSMLPSEPTEATIFCEIATVMKWSYVAVIHDADFTSAAKAFISQAQKRKICIGKIIAVKDRSDNQRHTEPLEYMQMLVRKLVVTAGARTVFTFLDDNNLFLLMKALVNEKIPVGRFVLVTKFDEDWSYDSIFLTQLLNFGHGFLFLEPARSNVTGFLEYFSKLSLLDNNSMPRKWLEEFWQYHFRCILSKSLPSALHKRANLCTGFEKITMEDINISPKAIRTILAVHALARSVQKYVGLTCPDKLSTIYSLKECAQSSSKTEPNNYRETQFQILKSLNFSYVPQPGKEPFWMNFNEDGSSNVGYTIRNLYRDQSGVYKAQEVGYWSAQSGVVLDPQSVALFDTLGERRLVESKCPSSDLCPMCYENGMMGFADRPEPPLALVNMSTVWGVLTAAWACMGLLVAIVCIVYFLFTFPIMYSTTILGYVSLAGVLSLYALSFAFIMPPGSWTCPIRKYCFGLCWAFFIGPLLVKVAHNWRSNAAEDYESSSSSSVASPGTLFTLALSVIGVQFVDIFRCFLSQHDKHNEILTFIPLHPNSSSPEGVWRCSSVGGDFEFELLISNFYVACLIVSTTIFSAFSFFNSDSSSSENKWTLVTCLCTVVVWLTWGLVATQSGLQIKDPVIAVCIIFNATIALVCLYLRKAFLYNVYRRRVKDYIGKNPSVQSMVGEMPGRCSKFLRSDFDSALQRNNDLLSDSLPHNLLRDQLSSGYYSATNNRNEERLVGSLSGGLNGSGIIRRQNSNQSAKSRSQAGITAYDNSSMDAHHF